MNSVIGLLTYVLDFPVLRHRPGYSLITHPTKKVKKCSTFMSYQEK